MTFLMRLLRLPRLAIKGTKLQNNFFIIFLYRLLMRMISRGHKDVYVDFRGITLAAEGGDITILPTLLDGSFEESEIDWLLNYLRKLHGKLLFVDIGANIGLYTSLVLMNYKTVKVIAIEPDVRNYRRLQLNLLNFDHKSEVEILKSAVGEASGGDPSSPTRRFLYEVNGGTSRLLAKDEGVKDAQVEEVPVITLDAILTNAKGGDFDSILIKIDVEGFEPEVINSGMAQISTLQPSILVEFTTNRSRLKLSPWSDQLLLNLFQVYKFATVFSNSNKIYVTSIDELRQIPEREVVNLLFSSSPISS
jgi:FkbM family methyltransferase